MKFIFGYKTHENEVRNGVVDAPSRDAAYAQLKARGIRPFRVDLAPGVMNRLAMLGKRSLAIALLSVALIAVFLRLHFLVTAADAPIARCQIYGDPAVLQRFESTGWADVFADPGERFLAGFAQPGRPVVRPDARELPRLGKLIEESLSAGSGVRLTDASGEESAKAGRIVSGMKRELADYLRDGGRAAVYVERLFERQEQECQFRERHLTELRRIGTASADFLGQLDDRNAQLRTMGILPISLREASESPTP